MSYRLDLHHEYNAPTSEGRRPRRPKVRGDAHPPGLRFPHRSRLHPRNQHELARPIAEHLQSKNVAAAQRLRHVVTGVSYAGGEGGIMCLIAPSDEQEALVISLTYVRVS